MENQNALESQNDECFYALQEILNLIKSEDCHSAFTPREMYLTQIISRVDFIAKEGIRTEYAKIIAPIIAQIRGSHCTGGKMVCPRCGGKLIYTVGVYDSYRLQCTTKNCISWSEIKGE